MLISAASLAAALSVAGPCPEGMAAVGGLFCLDRTEVTVAEYDLCVAQGACAPAARSVALPDLDERAAALFSLSCNRDRPGRDAHPINCLTVAQAAAYCAWRDGRLPEESEWLQAATGGSEDRTFPWGDRPPGPRLLNVCGGECRQRFEELGVRRPSLHFGDDGHPETAPVGGFPAGAGRWGHLDLAGNVWEFTATRSADSDRVVAIHGGGWAQTDPDMVRGAYRAGFPEDGRSSAVGFRCAADLAGEP